MEQRQVVDLDINLLQANPLQPRGLISPESINDLSASIKEHGILDTGSPYWGVKYLTSTLKILTTSAFSGQ